MRAPMAEFLPLCDLLFNVVSLAAYFCDVVFDVLLAYALYALGPRAPFLQTLTSIALSLLSTQLLSLHWYLRDRSHPRSGPARYLVILLHCCQLGVLWRYARLLAPVRLSTVKLQVRDLCVLRLVHGFVQAGPMLLIQLHLLAATSSIPRDLVTVSAALSLFSVCWGLASFSKHVCDVDRLLLTWLGVVSQLLWRAGTVTARALALTAYAASYHSWIFLVLALHWACMFLWLLSPRGAFHGLKRNKLCLCLLVSGVYVLAYVNLQQDSGTGRHVRSMCVFYVIMLLENALLVGAWYSAGYGRGHVSLLLPGACLGLFAAGVAFMGAYYRWFHVRRLLEKRAAPAGVFKCRFGAGAPQKRKRKKPTSFVPLPPPTSGPFWRRAPSSSENEASSAGSRVDIHQKLREKRQKQLAELRAIEEEIKQGKLVGPEGGPDARQPIPDAKRHLEPQLLSLASLNNLASYGVNLNRRPAPRAPRSRSRTPELLLAPRYLFCECAPPPPEVVEERALPSDAESQASLPRSYTLPREFKYYRRGNKARRAVRAVASANSSDGDVDSAEESDCAARARPAAVKQLKRAVRHETKL